MEVKVSQSLKVHTELIDSTSQRMNLEEKQSGLSLNSRIKKNSESKQQNKSVDDSKSRPKTPSISSKNSENIYNKEVNNEIIYYDNYRNPVVINNNLDNSNNSNVLEQNIPDEEKVVGVLPIEIDCPFCNNKIKSKTESKCACSAFLLILLLILCSPIICFLSICKAGRRSYKLCSCLNGEDKGCCGCCFDVIHTCPNCGKVVAESDSCSRICNRI